MKCPPGSSCTISPVQQQANIAKVGETHTSVSYHDSQAGTCQLTFLNYNHKLYAKDYHKPARQSKMHVISFAHTFNKSSKKRPKWTFGGWI